MQYYRSNPTGKILSENSLKVLNDVFGNDVVPSMVEDGLLVSIETPSVVDCIRSGNMATAIARYREIHDCGMEEAKKAVYSIRADISRTTSISNRRNKKAADKSAK